MARIPRTQLFLISIICLGWFVGCSNDTVTSVSPEVEGKMFSMDRDVLDENGEKGNINFRKAEFTIIDFWFYECPPCLQEMRQFPGLLSKSNGKYQIISVSVNSFDYWKNTIQDASNQRKYLFKGVQGWEHFVMRSDLDPRLKNDVSGDVLGFLQEKYKTNKFPLYLVINKEGRIVATPESATRYIKDSLL
jgi:thiol-disulfide isomerase/thioredoxin